MAMNQSMHRLYTPRFYPSTASSKNALSQRFSFLTCKISWDIPFDDYSPTDYTSPAVLSQPQWADLNFVEKSQALDQVKWHQMDGLVDRRSYEKPYGLDPKTGLPINPVERTGMTGRGLLGKWGPNHAVDVIATRWKVDDLSSPILVENEPVLEFLCIERRDGGGWAIPGGMIDLGESVREAITREFCEEVLNTKILSLSQQADHQRQFSQFIDKCGGVQPIFKGYVEDPRNTDNAWVETFAANFHQGSKSYYLKNLKPAAGDDAINIRWMTASQDLDLYASHKKLIEKVCQLQGAHW